MVAPYLCGIIGSGINQFSIQAYTREKNEMRVYDRISEKYPIMFHGNIFPKCFSVYDTSLEPRQTVVLNALQKTLVKV